MIWLVDVQGESKRRPPGGAFEICFGIDAVGDRLTVVTQDTHDYRLALVPLLFDRGST